MVQIGYFSLLLFCISTNMINGMENSMDITMLETRKEELPSPCMPGLEWYYQQDDPKTDGTDGTDGTNKFFKSEALVELLKSKFELNTLEFELLHQPDNPFDQQIEKQNSRKCSSLGKRKRTPPSHLFISSDDESFRNPNISDDHFHTIKCLICSKTIRARNSSRLISNYQKHCNNHSLRYRKINYKTAKNHPYFGL